MHQGGCVLVFGKPPIPGRAKTRLAAAVGEQAAARVAAALLLDTVERVHQALPGTSVVLATPEPDADHGLPGLPHWDQGGGDLGARVERCLRRALEAHPWALAIGADAPHVPAAHLVRAVGLLQSARAVIGPSRDGGFWVLGLRDCPEGLLADLPWSQPTTAHATIARLAARGMPAAEAPSWFDVDHEADLRELVAVGGAPRTEAVTATLW
jgi:rSAM/selenodomain-associated transferase 1